MLEILCKVVSPRTGMHFSGESPSCHPRFSPAVTAWCIPSSIVASVQLCYTDAILTPMIAQQLQTSAATLATLEGLQVVPQNFVLPELIAISLAFPLQSLLLRHALSILTLRIPLFDWHIFSLLLRCIVHASCGIAVHAVRRCRGHRCRGPHLLLRHALLDKLLERLRILGRSL